MMKKKNILKKIICAAAVLSAGLFLPGLFGGPAKAFAVTVEYSNLRQLVTEGNPDIVNSSYYTTVSNLEYQLGILKTECQNLTALSKLDTDTLDNTGYKSYANAMNKTITQLEKNYIKQTGSNASINTQIDAKVIMAQSAMISCKQMEINAQAKETTARAAEVKYQNTITRNSAGAATDDEVTTAHANMINAQSQAVSARQQADSSRRSFLQILGLSDDGTVEIADIPEPDLAAIDAVNLDADMQQAINNDSAVKSARHTSSVGTTTIGEDTVQISSLDYKTAAEEDAVETAASDLSSAYAQIQSCREQYMGALNGMTAAESTYQGAMRKKAAGMLTEADALTAEADYLNAQATFKSASMNLVSAYDSYNWMVKGAE